MCFASQKNKPCVEGYPHKHVAGNFAEYGSPAWVVLGLFTTPEYDYCRPSGQGARAVGAYGMQSNARWVTHGWLLIANESRRKRAYELSAMSKATKKSWLPLLNGEECFYAARIVNVDVIRFIPT